MSATVKLLGIRHHGPGSARSVVRALDALQRLVSEAGGMEALATDILRVLDDVRAARELNLAYKPDAV